MTYQICYTPNGSPENSRGVCMFDIEYYLTHGDNDKEKWFSEIHCLPCVDGLTMFLKDKFEDKNFDYHEFINDGNEIQEVRGLLYERHNNRPKDYKEANDFHYHEFGEEIRELFDNFCKNYGCWLNID